jgi:predicted nucleic-acid-binding protein
MRITPDTNVLLRAYVADDEKQADAAIDLLTKAEMVAVTLQSLCEFACVLGRQYEVRRTDIAAAIRSLLNTTNVVVNHPAVDAGLSHLEAGGDFADGIIAYEGAWLGGETFASFDRKAVDLVSAQGKSALLLS